MDRRKDIQNNVADKWEVKLSDWLPIATGTILFLATILYFFTREPLYDWYNIKGAGTVGDALRATKKEKAASYQMKRLFGSIIEISQPHYLILKSKTEYNNLQEESW